jgi:chromosome partitioning protein
MTDEFNDPRPRRRLFGRRRPDEEVVESADPRETPEADEPAPTTPEPAVATPEPAVATPEPTAATPEPTAAAPEAPVAETPPPQPPPTPVPDPEPPPQPEPQPTPPPAPSPVPDPEPPPAPPPEPAPQLSTSMPSLDGESAAVLELPRIIAIANQKGGVGKTTTAVNLGAALAESGLRVLVVDLDPQGNASTGLGINPRDVNSSIYDVLMHDTPALDAVEPTSLKNLFVIPATLDLAGAEIELVPAFSRELKLKRALESVRAEYDVVLIDCPPSLGLLTVNGLAAADDVIVPIQCEYYALEGLGQLLRNVALVRSSLNASLDVRGIILTMYDARTRLAEQVEDEVREHFGDKVYKTVVPRTVRLAEAPSFGQPVIVFDPTSRGATAYRDLAKEVSGGATRRTG